MDEVAAALRHQDALTRLERSAELTRERQEATAAHRERLKTNATIIEGANAKELMELQHELNRENRSLDHQFALAEDARELERQALEIIMRRRDDFIRHHWDMEQQILMQELRLVEKQVEASNDSAMSAQKHQQAKDLATLKHEQAKELKSHSTDEMIRLRKAFGELTPEDREKFFSEFEAEQDTMASIDDNGFEAD